MTIAYLPDVVFTGGNRSIPDKNQKATWLKIQIWNLATWYEIQFGSNINCQFMNAKNTNFHP